MKVMALKRLISATTDFGLSTHVMEKQVLRTQARLNQGIDLDGNAFAPYKDKLRKHPNSRPLEHAARLFDSPNYGIDKNLANTELTMKLTGQAARIAKYQNYARRFVGFSRKDRPEVREELIEMIILAYNKKRSV